MDGPIGTLHDPVVADVSRAFSAGRLRAALLTDAAALVLDLEVAGDLGHGSWEACALDRAGTAATAPSDVVLVLLTGERAGQIAAGRLRRIGEEHIISGRTRFSG